MVSETGKIFITYARQDSAAADSFVSALADCGLAPWLERLEIQTAASFADELANHLARSSYLIFLLSPHSLAALESDFGWTSALATKEIILISACIGAIERPVALSRHICIDLTEDHARGMFQLFEFLLKEQQPAFETQTTRGTESLLRKASRRQIRLVASHCIDEAAFKSFLFDAEISLQEVPGQSLHDRLVFMLCQLEKDGLIEQFADWLERERRSCVREQLQKLQTEDTWQLVHPATKNRGETSQPEGPPFEPPTPLPASARGYSIGFIFVAIGLLMITSAAGYGLHRSRDRASEPTTTRAFKLNGAQTAASLDKQIALGRSCGVLFATTQYDDKRWPSLKTPVRDAQEIADDLRAIYHFEIEKISDPNVADMRKKIRSLAEQKYADGDQLFIMFSGHGDKDETLKKGWIIARDSKADDRQSAYPYSELREDIDNIPCKHILLVLDVCFGGAFDPSIREAQSRARGYQETSTEQFIARKLRYQSRLYISSVDQQTEAPEGRGHSPFAWKLLEALRSGGGSDGVLTWNELVGFLEKLQPEPRGGVFPRSIHSDPGGDFLFVARK